MRDRTYLPNFLRKGWQLPNKKNRTQITDFVDTIEVIWCISNATYQKKIWVNHEIPEVVDSYDNTMLYFFENTDGVLEAKEEGRVKMTDKQYEMLKRLYDMVDSYEAEKNSPEVDKDVVKDPKWHVIRDYAKLVYKEITGEESSEKIDSWEIIPS